MVSRGESACNEWGEVGEGEGEKRVRSRKKLAGWGRKNMNRFKKDALFFQLILLTCLRSQLIKFAGGYTSIHALYDLDGNSHLYRMKGKGGGRADGCIA